MPDSLVDLGGGVKMADPSNFIGEVKPIDPIERYSKIQGIADISQRMDIRGRQEQRDAEIFPASLAKQQAEAASAQTKAIKDINVLATQGNSKAATFLFGELYPSMKGKVAVMLSIDPNKANKGIVDVINVEDGSIMYSADPFKDDRVNSDITLKRNLAEKYAEKKYQRGEKREELLLTMAKDISNESHKSIEESMVIANDILELSQTKDQKKLFGDQGILPKEVIDDYISTASVVSHVNKSGQFRFGLKPLDSSQEKDFRNGLSGIQTLSDNVIPLFQSVNENNTWLQTGLIGSSINSLQRKFKQGDPEFIALKNFTDGAKWELVMKYAATTFTDKAVENLKPLVPNVTDPLDIAMAKSVVFMSMFNSELHNSLNTYEANGKRVDGFRDLLNPNSRYNQIGSLSFATSEGRQSVIAESILNSLSEDTKKNPKMMELILNPMPSNFQKALKSEMINKGYEMPTRAATDMARDLFGMEK